MSPILPFSGPPPWEDPKEIAAALGITTKAATRVLVKRKSKISKRCADARLDNTKGRTE